MTMVAMSKVAMTANVVNVPSRDLEVVVFTRIAGVQWSNTVGSTLWGMASGVAVVLGIVLGLAEIVPASWVYRLPGVAWRRSVGPTG